MWGRAQVLARKPLWLLVPVFVVEVYAIVAIAWTAVRAESAWATLGLFVLSALMLLGAVMLTRIAYVARTTDVVPEWWYDGGAGGWLLNRRPKADPPSTK